MRYTDLGIGHPVMLRRTARDCFGPITQTPADAMDITNDESDDDGEGEGYDDEQEGDHDDLESEEGSELSDDLEDVVEDDEVDEWEEVDVFDDELSF